jgi:hypothetical protein
MTGIVAGAAAGVVAGVVGRVVDGVAAGVLFGVAAVVVGSFKAPWPVYEMARTWLALRRQLPWRLMSFLDDAHQQGVLRQAGPVYQFRHIELQHKLARTSAKIGFEYDVQDVNGNKYRVALVNVLDPINVLDPAGGYLAPDSGNRFVRAVFTITVPFGGLKGEDVKRAAAAIGSDGRIYSADINTVGDDSFDNRSIRAAMLGTPVTGSVTFQVPDGIKVLKIEWATSGRGSAVQWAVRRYDIRWAWLCPLGACRSRACPFAFDPPRVHGQLAALADELIDQPVDLAEVLGDLA